MDSRSLPDTSDHYSIKITSDIASPTRLRTPRWKLNTANWAGFQSDLNLKDITFSTPIETFCDYEERIVTAAKKNRKTTNLSINASHCKAWWIESCTRALRAKFKAL